MSACDLIKFLKNNIYFIFYPLTVYCECTSVFIGKGYKDGEKRKSQATKSAVKVNVIILSAFLFDT